MNAIRKLKAVLGVRDGYMDIDELRARIAIRRLFADEK